MLVPSPQTHMPITPALRRALFKAWRHKCAYCKVKPAEQVDHIFPRAKGGGDFLENYIAACEPCNSEKRDNILAEGYLRILEARATKMAPRVIKNLEIEAAKIARQRAARRAEKERESARKKAALALEREREKRARIENNAQRAARIKSKSRHVMKGSAPRCDEVNPGGWPGLELSEAQLKSRRKFLESIAVSLLFREVGHCFSHEPMGLLTQQQRDEVRRMALGRFNREIYELAATKSNSYLSARAKRLTENQRHNILPIFRTSICVDNMMEVSELASAGSLDTEGLSFWVEREVSERWAAKDAAGPGRGALVSAFFDSKMCSSHLTFGCTGTASDGQYIKYRTHPALPDYLCAAHHHRSRGIILPPGVAKPDDSFDLEECRRAEDVAAETFGRIAAHCEAQSAVCAGAF